MNSFIHKGGVWVLAQNLLTLAALCLGPAVHGDPWAWIWRRVGATVFFVGAVLGVAGVRALGRNRSVYPMPLADGHLVQTGVYSIVRHPLYSSLILLTLGWSLLWSSSPGLIVSFALTLVLNGKAIREERWLREKYSEYGRYAGRVRRLIPWVY